MKNEVKPLNVNYPPLAQLDRVPDSDSDGRGFESPRAGHAGAKFALLRHIFCLRQKISICPFSCLFFFFFAKSHARLTCSVVNTFTTARCRYQLLRFAGVQIQQPKCKNIFIYNPDRHVWVKAHFKNNEHCFREHLEYTGFIFLTKIQFLL